MLPWACVARRQKLRGQRCSWGWEVEGVRRLRPPKPLAWVVQGASCRHQRLPRKTTCKVAGVGQRRDNLCSERVIAGAGNRPSEPQSDPRRSHEAVGAPGKLEAFLEVTSLGPCCTGGLQSPGHLSTGKGRLEVWSDSLAATPPGGSGAQGQLLVRATQQVTLWAHGPLTAAATAGAPRRPRASPGSQPAWH